MWLVVVAYNVILQEYNTNKTYSPNSPPPSTNILLLIILGNEKNFPV